MAESIRYQRELNKRFYKDISNWYFWAIDIAEFQKDVHENRDIQNSLSVIRMLTRLILFGF
ncbi:MAG: hypothetical protein H7A23_19730 [Leptospiraceae bacterium]|nr:hypothetical protein [Leptospiraceae bacterium]